MGPLLIFVGSVTAWAASIYTVILLARLVLDWTRILVPRFRPPGWLLFIFDWIYRLTDPPIRWMRRFIPPIRLGNIALDVGFMVVFIATIVLERLGNWLVYLGYIQS